MSYPNTGDEVDGWRPGERRFIPALYARPQECEILAIDGEEVRFRTPAGDERSISRHLLRQLLTHQVSPLNDE